MTHKVLISLVGVLTLAAVAGIGLHSNVIKLPITRGMHPSYVTDFSDDTKLMGAAHNVFVGKVRQQVGNKDVVTGVPGTQFEVDVLLNIKGDLKGSIIVQQQGGYKNGILYLVQGGDVMKPNSENGDKLLQPGSSYLFTARFSNKSYMYGVISHPNGRKLISSDSSLSNEQLESLADNDPKIRRLRDAYPNEQLLQADAYYDASWNAYTSRRYDSNGQLIDDTVELRKAFEAANVSPGENAALSPSSELSNSPEVSIAPSTDPAISPQATMNPSDEPPTSTPTPETESAPIAS